MQFPSSGVRRVCPSSSQSSRPPLAGSLLLKDAKGKVVAERSIYANKEVIIGRDRTKCQWTIDDAQISRKHVRIYSVVYDADDPSEVDMLVYAEDLSRNGTYWNGSFIGKGDGGFLLSQDDCLKLSPNVHLSFRSHRNLDSVSHFDLVQEKEMKGFFGYYVVTDRLLGSGAFGRVYMAIEHKSRSQLACKIVDLRPLRRRSFIGRKEEPAAAEDVDIRFQLRKVKDWGEKQKQGNKLEDKLKVYYREVDILASIKHPNIIGLEKVFITDNTLYMFQDLVTAGDLFSYIESKNGRLLEVEAAVVIRQILIALCFLHERNIVHRDLKPDNILMTSLSSGCRVVLTDFGAARRIKHATSRMSSIAGTEEYAAPEIYGRNKHFVRRAGYTKAIDLWSLGCVSVVLLTGGSAFNDPRTNSYSQKLAAECNLEYLRESPDWSEVRPRPAVFVEKLLVLDEEQRMTAQEALDHEWFSNEIHKTNFQELYLRTIKHWRARQTPNNMIDFQNAWDIQAMDSVQGMMTEKKARKPRNDRVPQDAHLKPFPRNLFLQLQPPRKYRNSLNSPEVKAAIEGYWSDLSSDEEHEAAPRITQKKIEKAIRQPNTVMGPPRLTMKSTPRRTRTIFNAQKTPTLKRRVSFREHTDADDSEMPTSENYPCPNDPASNDGVPSSLPVVSSYFKAAVPLRPADVLKPGIDSRMPGGPSAQESAEKRTDDDVTNAKQRGTPANNPHPRPTGDSLRNDSEPAPLPDQANVNTPSARPTLRRRSFAANNALQSASSKKWRRGSVFDMFEDAEDEMEIETSPCAAKRQKRNLRPNNVDASADGADHTIEDQEVTLPHHPVSYSAPGISESQDLYLPR